MPQAFELIRGVLDKYRGLPDKLAGLTDKSAEIYRSHGREPKTTDPIASGNVSPVTHYMRYVRLFNAGQAGAGRMLSRRVYDALEREFAELAYDADEQADIECDVLKETCDVSVWLAKFDVDKAERRDLVQFIDECKQAEDAIATARSSAQVRLRLDKTASLAPPAEVSRFARNGK
jgi:hypothetical protein